MIESDHVYRHPDNQCPMIASARIVRNSANALADFSDGPFDGNCCAISDARILAWQAIENIRTTIRAPGNSRGRPYPSALCQQALSTRKRKCICAIPRDARRPNHELVRVRFLIFRR
jgi:hypothetical protein